MKRAHILGCIAVALMAVGCTTTTTTTTASTNTLPDPGRRSYSQEQLLKTGRQTPGEALAQSDPAITISGRH